MSVLGSLLRREERSLNTASQPLTSSALVAWLGGGGPTAAGVPVNERSSLRFSAVWRAVNLIAGTGASLPLVARDVNTRQPVPARLLANPNPDMTAFELWELAYVHLLLWGNAYLQKVRNGAGQLVELWPLQPQNVRVGRVRPQPDLPTGKVFEVTDSDGQQHAMSSVEVLHIPGLGYDGCCGVGPISLARQSIALGLAAEEYGARFFGSGSLMSGILTTDQRLNQQSADDLKRRWRERVAGLGNAHDVAVLDSGAKFQPLSIPNDDAQFIESRKFQVLEVCRWFGVPPHLLFDVERSTSWGTGIEEQTLGFLNFALYPTWLARVEQRVTLEATPAGTYAEYDLDRFQRGDAASRWESYNSGRLAGALTLNDINRKEGRPTVPWGDTYLVPSTYSVVDADGNVVIPAGGQQPAPAPAEPPPARSVVKHVEHDEHGRIATITEEVR
jgi:HK97 family phage portal protein